MRSTECDVEMKKSRAKILREGGKGEEKWRQVQLRPVEEDEDVGRGGGGLTGHQMMSGER